ncbi:MAG: dTDP-4-dehydrorhamnose reductase [Wenzhouxiangellaceae bacterium]|nr:dTDP-4-dehydrorhamnose reductase [Wenzhouxiangellaceae bacterium]
MRILLTGAGGQLGRHLAPRLASLGEVIGTDRSGGGDFACDLSDRRLVDKMLGRVRPDLVLNAAAYTAVDRAEDEPVPAARINGELPGWLGEWCRAQHAAIVHFSTDYVFSGVLDRPWREDDTTAPGNVYGHSKLAGERALLASGAQGVIIRTAWLYSHFPGNFLSAILTRAAQGNPLKIVSDQVGSPTWAGTLAEATRRLIELRERWSPGCQCFHVAGQGQMSWYEFGVAAIEAAVAAGALDRAVPIAPIDSAAWPQKARRPQWSVLDCGRYQDFTGHHLPTVNDDLDHCLQFWKEQIC